MIQWLALLAAVAVAQSTTASWLDRPLTNWNHPGSVPRPVAAGETVPQIAVRCGMEPRRGSPAELALAEAGWLPYLHVDREIVRADIEILAGLAAADVECRPSEFNIFVFVAGRFAGTLSPLPMRAGVDGGIGAVRLAADDTISADFARYLDRDTPCCPSGRVNVRFRIDRTNSPAVVIPVAVHAIR
jgi:hypothetical protein